MTSSIRLGLMAAAFVFVTSCIGDPGYTVRLQNTLDTPVMVTEIASIPGGPTTKRLGPHEVVNSFWRVPNGSGDERRAVVIATDEQGVLIFCRQFSFDEVKGDLEWRVDITRGRTDCR